MNTLPTGVDVRTIERLLRRAGLSQSQAKRAIAAGRDDGFAALLRDDPDLLAQLQEAAAAEGLQGLPATAGLATRLRRAWAALAG